MKQISLSNVPRENIYPTDMEISKKGSFIMFRYEDDSKYITLSIAEAWCRFFFLGCAQSNEDVITPSSHTSTLTHSFGMLQNGAIFMRTLRKNNVRARFVETLASCIINANINELPEMTYIWVIPLSLFARKGTRDN
jgi:hypothetical protein